MTARADIEAAAPMTIDDLRAAWPGVVIEGENLYTLAAFVAGHPFGASNPSELDQRLRELRGAITMGHRTAEKERADVRAFGASMERRSRGRAAGSFADGVAALSKMVEHGAHVGASEEP